jgi:NADPH2:quinone reductase
MFRKADVSAGDLVFVPGATGGVGVASVQLADAVGARTIGTSTSAEKLERLEELGCDITVQSADPDEIASELGGVEQVDAVINHLSGEYTKLGLRLMKRGGTQAICGGTAASKNEFSTPPFFLNQQEIVGSTMGTQPELEKLVRLVEGGEFDPVVDETYALEETRDAFADMEDRDAFGKLVIEPTQ